jgi:hypothetical protein
VKQGKRRINIAIEKVIRILHPEMVNAGIVTKTFIQSRTTQDIKQVSQ